MKATIKKNYESGKLLGLKVGPNGESFIRLVIENENIQKAAEIEFLIDTGFNGYLQLTPKVIKDLELDVINQSSTIIADGSKKTVGISKSKVRMLDLVLIDFPLQIQNGPFLLGTRFLKDINQMLILDPGENYLTLTRDKKVRKKVKKTVDKYAR